MPVLALALLLPSLFYRYFVACRPAIALIDTVLIGVIDRPFGDWLLVMIRGFDLGCLAMAKNAIEDRKIAIKEPRHV